MDSHKNKEKGITEVQKSVYNLISGVGGQIVSAVVGLIIPRLILLHYGSEANGLLNSVNQIFQYVALLEAGVGTVTTQALYSRIARNDREGISSCMQATAHYYRNTGIAYSAVVVFFAVLYPYVFHVEFPAGQVAGMITLMGVNGAINFFTAGRYRILLEADGQKYIWNTANMVTMTLANLIKALLIIQGKSMIIMQLGYTAVSLLQLAAVYGYGKKKYSWLDKKIKPDFSAVSQRYSALVHQVSGLIFGSTDMILLTAMCDLKQVSIYSVYSMVMNLVNNLISQISGSVTYKMGQIYYKDKERFILYHHVYEIANLILVFSAFTVAYLFLPAFIGLYTAGITDANYQQAYLPILFVLVQLLSCGRTASANVINYAGEFKNTQNRSIIESVINIVVSIVGIRYFGIYGALFGTIAALLYRTNDMIWYAAKRILQISPWYTYRRWLGCGALFVVIGRVQNSLLIQAAGYLELVLKAAVSGIVFMILYSVMEIILDWKFLHRFWKNK